MAGLLTLSGAAGAAVIQPNTIYSFDAMNFGNGTQTAVVAGQFVTGAQTGPGAIDFLSAAGTLTVSGYATQAFSSFDAMSISPALNFFSLSVAGGSLKVVLTTTPNSSLDLVTTGTTLTVPYLDVFTVDPQQYVAVPEPSTIASLGLGLGLLGLIVIKRRRDPA